MRWVTRENANVDRIACPWLITRFIDRDAEFLFVPRHEVLEVADREGAFVRRGRGRLVCHRERVRAAPRDRGSPEDRARTPDVRRPLRVVPAADRVLSVRPR